MLPHPARTIETNLALWIYIIYIVVGLVALWFIGKLFKPDSRLLRVEIATDDGVNYLVNSENLNQECKPIEWVWLNLHLPAKLIYNIGNQTALQLDKECLMELMCKYSQNNWKTSIFRVLHSSFHVSPSPFFQKH